MKKGIASTRQQQLQQQEQNDGQSTGSSSSGSCGAGSGGGGLVLKKGPWTAVEDAVLIEHVKKNGEGNWNSVRKSTGLARCGKSCRLRWTNHLRPNLKKGSFTPEEERLILKLHAQLGNKWARMAAQLPGRTDNEIKNYWNTRIKQRIRQGLPLCPHDIAPEHLPSPSVLRSMEPRSNAHTPIQILTPPRPTSQDLPQTPGSMLLSPQYTQHSIKSSLNNCLYYPSPSLACPASTFTNTHITPVLASSPLRLKGSYRNTTDFSLPFLPISLGSSLLPSVPAPTQLPNMVPFQFSPLSCNVSSPQYVQTQLGSDRYSSSVSVFPSKSELPSSQLYLSQIGKTETDVKQRQVMYCSGSGLLEDYLEDARALNENPQTQSSMNLRVEKLDVSLRSGCDWDARSSLNTSAANLGHSHSEIDTHKGFGLPFGQEGINAEKDTAQQIYSMQEENWSKLLNVIPSKLQRGNPGHYIPDIDTQHNICLPLVQEAQLEKEKLDLIPSVQADASKLVNFITPAIQFSSGYDINDEFCNRQSSGYASAGADVTMGGLEMQQQLALSLPVSTAVDKERTPVPDSWNN
ncbi:hypothetical protein BT93_F2901 [Corymbia citriodora subsp. variegata]|nr:hypothetical protein BT93_F2901 [Corymbia citriodora subsp. variegata]